MRLIATPTVNGKLARMRRRCAREDGFTALAAIAVLMLTSLLVSAAFVAAQSDIHSTQYDLNQKLAFSAAKGGVNEFTHHLNQDPNYWAKCKSQGVAPLPGSTIQEYSYQPIPANGHSICDLNSPIDSMIDIGTGSFRMRFSGFAGTSPQAERTLVASFRRDSPLDYLWYTVYETLDPNTYDDPSAHQDCAAFHRNPNPRPDDCGNIDWISGDSIKGPMYTQDQYAICGSPTFGRNSNDKIESLATSTHFSDCSDPGDNVDMNGTEIAKAPFIGLPTYNTQLRQDAIDGAGIVIPGPATIKLSGGTAYVSYVDTTGVQHTDDPIDLSQRPIIYVDNGTAGCSAAYSPYNVDYSLSGGCGDAYVSGAYSKGVTIAAANDVIVSGNITHLNSGAMAALVANNFVRVMHGRIGRDPSDNNDCGSLDPVHTLPDPQIDAAILALNHSFIVDNYDCGSPLGQLHVSGAIAQRFRGTVGTHSGSTVKSGYLKNYTYDDRLHSQEPPYLFDIQDASWHIDRETLCVPGSSDPTNTC